MLVGVDHYTLQPQQHADMDSLIAISLYRVSRSVSIKIDLLKLILVHYTVFYFQYFIVLNLISFEFFILSHSGLSSEISTALIASILPCSFIYYFPVCCRSKQHVQFQFFGKTHK